MSDCNFVTCPCPCRFADPIEKDSDLFLIADDALLANDDPFGLLAKDTILKQSIKLQ